MVRMAFLRGLFFSQCQPQRSSQNRGNNYMPVTSQSPKQEGGKSKRKYSYKKASAVFQLQHKQGDKHGWKSVIQAPYFQIVKN